MAKRKNYPYKDPIEIIRENTRQYNELLQENKMLKKENQELRKLRKIHETNVKNIGLVLGYMVREFNGVKNNILIARNSKADLRDFYIDKTLYGLDQHIDYLFGEIDKLVKMKYLEYPEGRETFIEEANQVFTPLPMDLLLKRNNDD